MEEITSNILQEAEAYVRAFMSKRLKKEYHFHNFEHTRNVVEACSEIANGFDLREKEVELLLLAAWFHDTGYDKGSEGHEKRSIAYAEEFMEEAGYPAEGINVVQDCIWATTIPQQPKNLLEQILCDADLSHLGKKIYWDMCGRLRMELTATQNILKGEQQWVAEEMDFLKAHQYHTYMANELYNKGKEKHLKQLRKRQLRLDPQLNLTPEEIVAKEKKKAKKKRKASKVLKNSKLELKQLDLGRGVETMYRATYRTHINLSSIADNKANIMLSINAIIISISLPTLVQRFDTNPKLIIPTVILLGVCLTSIVFATLSTRPKVTEGKFSREDIEQRRSNLLFFGNFYNMPLDDFHWGMMEMIKDSDFLYSSMTRDLYFLGVVLAKKYKYLRICYTIFMYGLIVSVIAFALVFLSF